MNYCYRMEMFPTLTLGARPRALMNIPCVSKKNPNNKKGDLVSGTKLCVRGCTLFSSSFCSFWCLCHTILFSLFLLYSSWIAFQHQEDFACSVQNWVVYFSPTAPKSTADLHIAFQYSTASSFTHNLISLYRSEFLIMKSWTNNKGHHWCLLSPH